MSSGQPSVANGHSALENHVSSTSGSRSQPSPDGGSSPTWVSSPRYQTGIWWPHHSWREMHHGRMFSSQSTYRRDCDSGWIFTRPDVTASIAGAASSSIRMNHWSEMSGSMRSPERWEYGTLCVYGSCATTRSPSAATTASRASSAVMPANCSPASAVIRPSSPITVTAGRPCLRPISKSLGSWPGVIFRLPVPKSVLTYSSAITGSSRPTSGSVTVVPTRCR